MNLARGSPRGPGRSLFLTRLVLLDMVKPGSARWRSQAGSGALRSIARWRHEAGRPIGPVTRLHIARRCRLMPEALIGQASLYAYGPKSAMPLHCHSEASIGFVLAGTVRETTPLGQEIGGPGSLVFKAAGLPHSNDFGRGGALMAGTRVSPAMQRLLNLEWRWMHGSRAAAISFGLASELISEAVVAMEFKASSRCRRAEGGRSCRTGPGGHRPGAGCASCPALLPAIGDGARGRKRAASCLSHAPFPPILPFVDQRLCPPIARETCRRAARGRRFRHPGGT